MLAVGLALATQGQPDLGVVLLVPWASLPRCERFLLEALFAWSHITDKCKRLYIVTDNYRPEDVPAQAGQDEPRALAWHRPGLITPAGSLHRLSRASITISIAASWLGACRLSQHH